MSPGWRPPEYLPSERSCSSSQASSVVVRQMQSTTLELVIENTILLQQIVDDGLLVSIDPAGKSGRKVWSKLALPRGGQPTHAMLCRQPFSAGPILVE